MTDKESFLALCNDIEKSDECQFTINELQEKLSKLSGKEEDYSNRHLKELLLEHFKTRMVISNTTGRRNIICLSNTAHRIMDAWYKDRDSKSETEKLRIVLAAADIIKEDIQKKAYDITKYPKLNDIKTGGEDLVPNTLTTFTQQVTEKKNVFESAKVTRKCLTIYHAK